MDMTIVSGLVDLIFPQDNGPSILDISWLSHTSAMVTMVFRSENSP